MLSCGNPQLLKLANQDKPRGINPCKHICTNETLSRHHLPPSHTWNPIFSSPSITMAAAILSNSCRKLSDHYTCCSSHGNHLCAVVHPCTCSNSSHIHMHHASISTTAAAIHGSACTCASASATTHHLPCNVPAPPSPCWQQQPPPFHHQVSRGSCHSRRNIPAASTL